MNRGGFILGVGDGVVGLTTDLASRVADMLTKKQKRNWISTNALNGRSISRLGDYVSMLPAVLERYPSVTNIIFGGGRLDVHKKSLADQMRDLEKIFLISKFFHKELVILGIRQTAELEKHVQSIAELNIVRQTVADKYHREGVRFVPFNKNFPVIETMKAIIN